MRRNQRSATPAELHELAETWGRVRGVAEAVSACGDDPRELWRACVAAAGSGGDGFGGAAVAVVDFVRRWHWMSDNDEDILAQHWLEAPDLPLSVFASLVRGISRDDRTPSAPPRQDSGMARHVAEVERLRAMAPEDDAQPHGVWTGNGQWPTVYGAWRMACSLWCMAHGVWPTVYGAWPMADGTWHMAHGLVDYGLQPTAYGPTAPPPH